ncbi:MAG TPA: hypothetical protein VHI77_00955 [Solirubrobacterales bacterium]|nr:hypothetical protein [Solirubrobacterales bacterium]
MARVSESRQLVEGILRLRRVERIPEAAADVAPVRRDLEARLGPSLTRSRAAQLLGVSQTALDRWVAAGRVPTIVTPAGRREVPRRFVIELREEMSKLMAEGRTRHPLAAALAARREQASSIGGPVHADGLAAPEGHRSAERRALAMHRVIAGRLSDTMLEEARDRVERMEAEGHLHPRYSKRWREVLARPVGEVAAALVATDQEGVDLRQNSPFAGVLNEQERRRIIDTVR